MRTLHLAGIWGSLVLAGCVMPSPDPKYKLDQAAALLNEWSRPIPAEHLIWESMAAYEKEDCRCPMELGLAYQYYGIFLTSGAVTGTEEWYRRHGFDDASVTFDNRLAKGVEYYDHSLEQFRLSERQRLDAANYDRLANTYFNMAVTYHYIEDRLKACESMNKSMDAADENDRRNPTKKVPEFAREKMRAFLKDNACTT